MGIAEFTGDLGASACTGASPSAVHASLLALDPQCQDPLGHGGAFGRVYRGSCGLSQTKHRWANPLDSYIPHRWRTASDGVRGGDVSVPAEEQYLLSGCGTPHVALVHPMYPFTLSQNGERCAVIVASEAAKLTKALGALTN